MRGGTRRSFTHRCVDAGRAPVRQDGAIGSGSLGGAQDRADVVRIGEMVEHDDQSCPAAGMRENLVQRRVFKGRCDGHDALMCFERHAIEVSALLEANGHVTFLRLREQRTQRTILFSIGCNVNRAQPLAGDERLGDRMDPVDEIVEVYWSEAPTLHEVPSLESLSSTPQRCNASRSRSEADQSFARRASERSASTRSIASAGEAPRNRRIDLCLAQRGFEPLDEIRREFDRRLLQPGISRGNAEHAEPIGQAFATGRRARNDVVEYRERRGGIHVIVERGFHSASSSGDSTGSPSVAGAKSR